LLHQAAAAAETVTEKKAHAILVGVMDVLLLLLGQYPVSGAMGPLPGVGLSASANVNVPVPAASSASSGTLERARTQLWVVQIGSLLLRRRLLVAEKTRVAF
jgi:hypothetical protein